MAEDTKHLEFLQSTIQRLSGHSFVVKGWNVTLASAIIAVILKEHQPCYALPALAPVVVFWFLDAYFLALERGFRALFTDAVARFKSKEPATYDMAPAAPGPLDVLRCAARPAVLLTHGPLVVMLLAIWLHG